MIKSQFHKIYENTIQINMTWYVILLNNKFYKVYIEK